MHGVGPSPTAACCSTCVCAFVHTLRMHSTVDTQCHSHTAQYGIVDENNPYDKLQLTATLSSSDPLFRLKRNILAANQLSTMQTFDMSRTTPLPPTLLPFMRLALTTNEAAVDVVQWGDAASPIDQANETVAVEMLVAYLDKRLQGYPTSIEEDAAIIESSTTLVRQKVAARLVRIEKQILQAARQQLVDHAQGLGLELVVTEVPSTAAVKLS